MRVPLPWFGTLSAGVAVVGLLAAGASATEPLDQKIRTSAQLPDTDASFDTDSPALATNTSTGGYLQVWRGETATNDEFEIFGRIAGSDGRPTEPAFRLSEMGQDSDASSGAHAPAVAYNTTRNEYLVTWHGNDAAAGLASGEYEIYAQRVSPDGREIGADTRLSDMGNDGSSAFGAFRSAVAYNTNADEYFVTWHGDDNTGDLVNNEFEIFAQRVGANGKEIGTDTRLSDMGTDGVINFSATASAVAYNSAAAEYLVTWQGDDTTGALVDGEFEIFGQRVSATGKQIGVDTRLSEMGGVDGVTDFEALDPAVAYNSAANEYLVTWWGDDDSGALVDGEREIFAQRVSAAGVELGPDLRISDMGVDGDTRFAAYNPALAYSSGANEYLVTWWGNDGRAPLAEYESEIFAQRVNATGRPIAGETRISDMGVDGDATYGAFFPAVAYNPTNNSYLASWEGDDTAPPLLNDEFEIWSRRVQGGAVSAAGDLLSPKCASPDVPDASGGGGEIKLTISQLKINQKIGAAAVRRANAVNAWLDSGIEGRDLCGGGLTSEDLDSTVGLSAGALRGTGPLAQPRPVLIAAAEDKGATFTLSSEQLRTNQRVYAAAVRRANALKDRLEGNLTGGDIVNGTLGRDRLRPDIWIVAPMPPSVEAGRSATVISEPEPSHGTITPSLKQLRINQRIAAAAVRRTNELRTLLATGLTGENFVDGSITAADLAP